jgi:hypothetical protein
MTKEWKKSDKAKQSPLRILEVECVFEDQQDTSKSLVCANFSECLAQHKIQWRGFTVFLFVSKIGPSVDIFPSP